MNDNNHTPELQRAIDNAMSRIPVKSCNESDLQQLSLSFSDVANAASRDGNESLAEAAEMLSRLVEIAATWIARYPDDTHLVEELVQFTQDHARLFSGANDQQQLAAIDEMIQTANERWADYFMVVDESEEVFSEVGEFVEDELLFSDDDEFSQDAAASDESSFEDDDEPMANGQIELLLSAISESAPAEQVEQAPQRQSDGNEQDSSVVVDATTDHPSTSQPQADSFNSAKVNRISDRQAREELQSDREMLEAYLDDSMRCVGSMEKSALSLDANPQDKESIRAFCRELHTLKGASATVGLSSLASHLHELENSLEDVFADEGADADAELLFVAIDFVRREMDSLQPKTVDSSTDDPQPVAASSGVSPSFVATASSPDFASFGSGDDSSIRIRASRLDRLMDMLAELVVLRNRRESHASEYDLFHGELSRCASRLSFAEEQSGRSTNSTIISEVSKDIEVVSRGLRELQKPVVNDNASISRFIRDFRQELMHLRRVPVSGLFSRLQRAARDAAKTERKNVRVEVVGENTGLEQEIQERLYESLLHVVRNCVSHGIEDPEKRAAAGKDGTGVITLEASGSAQLLVIEVRDDGNGVNYDAVRNRGIEKGLLSPNQRATNAELANLIFHPGFSTKETASETSGRGVGMDVVATTLEQLQGRIEVESTTGQGTTIRLLIPLRTGIEHVMVFRSDNQLFALPMQSITAAKSSNAGIQNITRLSLSNSGAAANKPKTRSDSESGDVLVLKRAGTPANSRHNDQIALAVEELLGPEEVVVRGLPGLLRNHPLFCGITLSGSGEKVLLLESERVAEYCEQLRDDSVNSNCVGTKALAMKALVVDDSLTARKFLTKILNQNGFTTIEVGDGIEAIEQLHRGTFDLVVTDLDMPRMGGLELLTDIKSGQYCTAPVIVVSSRDDDNFRSQAMDLGASDYVTKPVSQETFQQRLETVGLLPLC